MAVALIWYNIELCRKGGTAAGNRYISPIFLCFLAELHKFESLKTLLFSYVDILFALDPLSQMIKLSNLVRKSGEKMKFGGSGSFSQIHVISH